MQKIDFLLSFFEEVDGVIILRDDTPRLFISHVCFMFSDLYAGADIPCFYSEREDKWLVNTLFLILSEYKERGITPLTETKEDRSAIITAVSDTSEIGIFKWLGTHEGAKFIIDENIFERKLGIKTYSDLVETLTFLYEESVEACINSVFYIYKRTEQVMI